VGLRTVHLVSMALLLGGIAWGADPLRLKSSLLATVASGILLLALDLAKGSSSLVQGSGIAVVLKLALLGLGNLMPAHRFAWYLAATAVASAGSHMSSDWRHFSILERKVIRH
jgi:hypothetical protein